MADDRLFFKPIAAVHPKYGTPHVAIVLSALLGIAYVSIQTFEQLADAFILGIWPFYALAVGAVLILRRRHPEVARPYRTLGYPVVPLIFLVASVGMLANAVIEQPVSTLLGFAAILAGVPVYYIWQRRRLGSRYRPATRGIPARSNRCTRSGSGDVRKLLTAALLSLLAGCRGGDTGVSGGPVAEWQVDTAAVLEIGEVEGDSAYQLFNVRSLAELSDGSIAIANSGTNQVKLYDARGRYLRTLGRTGEGPGEFTILLDVRARGDTVYAYDRMTGRLTRFLASGKYLDDQALRRSATMTAPNFSGLLAGGAVAGWLDHIPDHRPDGFLRQSGVLVRITAAGVDTLGSFPAAEVIIRTRAVPGGAVMMGTSLDFYRTFLAAAADDRIYAGPTDSAIINVWDAGGQSLPPIRWDDHATPVDDALVNASLEREAHNHNMEPREVGARRKLVEESGRPATAPVFDRLCIAPGGELWVRRYARPDATTSEWLVFDRAGALRARVRLPRAHELRAVGRERVYTVERDEYDVEYVRAYPLRK